MCRSKVEVEEPVSGPREEEWKEAKRRCRLSDDDIRMAKELGFKPRSLIKNIPSPSQKWKAPVREWVRSLHAEKFPSRPEKASITAEPPAQAQSQRSQVIEFRNPDHPWPDRPDIPEYVPDDLPEFEDIEDMDEFGGMGFRNHFDPSSDKEIADENTLMLRRQCLFRWAAQSIARSASELAEIRKVAAFGAVAQPLRMEIPRFREFRRFRVSILHECADLDLAVWTADLGQLMQLKRALQRGLSSVQDTPYGGVAHHQVDLHVFEAQSATYRGGLCIFGQCPKPGKRECLVPGCGAQPFLQQFEKYRFDPARFQAAPKVILFDRASGFLVRPLKIEDVRRTRTFGAGRDEDVPF